MKEGTGAAQAPDRKIEQIQLFFRQDEEERFDEHQSFAKAGIEIEMAGVQSMPGNGRVGHVARLQVASRFDERVAEFFDDMFERRNLLNKL